MSRTVGTISRGIRTPIIKSGDDLVKIVADSVLEAAKEEKFEISVSEKLIKEAFAPIEKMISVG